MGLNISANVYVTEPQYSLSTGVIFTNVVRYHKYLKSLLR